MSWKQCAIPLGTDYRDIQMSISEFSLSNGDPPDFALFARSNDERSEEVLLLSPAAVALMGNALPPIWTDSTSPEQFGWSLLFGHDGAHERFGLRTPREMGEV